MPEAGTEVGVVRTIINDDGNVAILVDDLIALLQRIPKGAYVEPDSLKQFTGTGGFDD